jgi:hypothetical protein
VELELTPVGLGEFAKCVLVPGESQRERAFGHVRVLALKPSFLAIVL